MRTSQSPASPAKESLTMPEFAHTDLLPLGPDTTQYRRLTAEGVRGRQAFGREFLEVDPEVLTLLAREGMRDIALLLRPGHLRQLRSILDDPEASPNDRFVARDLLTNACIAAGGVLPMCQDTGTAIIMGKRGGEVLTDGHDEKHLARGVYDSYTQLNLRYSQLAPLTMWDERNTGSNLPAQIELYAAPGAEYKFLLMAKGGGSANKSFLYQQSKAVLNEASMVAFLTEKIGSLGTAACPALAKITADGVFLEELETDPAQYLPDVAADDLTGDVVPIDLSRPMHEIRAELTKHPVATRLSLTGRLVVARDIAHAKIAERLAAGEPMPQYLIDHPVYYAGPAKTPEGYASGSFGPTPAGRMDSYVEQFQAAGGSLVMLAKGNRSPAVTRACQRYGGFYLGSAGGAAARLAKDCITKVEVLEYPELGMEAVWQIEVRDFPAFIIVDDKGNDFFADPAGPLLTIGNRP